MRYSLLGTVASLKTSLGGSGGAASDEDILRWAREKAPPAHQPKPEEKADPSTGACHA